MESRPLYTVCTFSSSPRSCMYLKRLVPSMRFSLPANTRNMSHNFRIVGINGSGKSPFKMDERQPGSCDSHNQQYG